MTDFDETTAVRLVHDPAEGAQQSTAVFAADLDPSWTSLRGMHGGYLTAIAVRAAEHLLPDRAVRTVTTSFLRTTTAGAAHLHVDVLRSGRSISTVITRIRQHERDVAITRITMLTASTAPTWTTPAADRPLPIGQCVKFDAPPAFAHFGQAEFLIDPTTIPTGAADSARIAGHVRPRQMRTIDAAWLVMIGDWFPPSPFRRIAPPTGGVSIDYTAHLHRSSPAFSGFWLEGVFRSPNNVDGLALEHGQLSTPDGQTLLETFHTRWTGR